MEILSIIPARKNSKGIQGKNTIPFFGKPLIVWNIEAAKKSKYITRTIVSTDGDEIKKISMKSGAEVIDRPADLSGDTASSESALLHALDYLEMNENYIPDILVFMQCTSPLTDTEDIDNCIEKLLNEEADSATTVTDFHYFIWENTNKGAVGINHDKKLRLRRQDRESQYLETGAVYVMRTDGFKQFKHRFFGKTVISYMPPERVKEIDEPFDIVIAEAMLQKQLDITQQLELPENIEAVLFDFDGVMTDDSVVVDENGKESVRVSRSDGMGISLLIKAGIRTAVLSTERNPVVQARCKKLKIECFNNLGENKFETMKTFLNNNNISSKNTVFMGNDINDIDCLKFAGFSVVPINANIEVKKIADLVIPKEGGNGAVRELCNLIIKKNC